MYIHVYAYKYTFMYLSIYICIYIYRNKCMHHSGVFEDKDHLENTRILLEQRVDNLLDFILNLNSSVGGIYVLSYIYIYIHIYI
jgi:hypothetical protein